MAKTFYEKLNDLLNEVPDGDNLLIYYRDNNGKFAATLFGVENGTGFLPMDLSSTMDMDSEFQEIILAASEINTMNDEDEES